MTMRIVDGVTYEQTWDVENRLRISRNAIVKMNTVVYNRHIVTRVLSLKGLDDEKTVQCDYRARFFLRL
jgi:hypothetical protein